MSYYTQQKVLNLFYKLRILTASPHSSLEKNKKQKKSLSKSPNATKKKTHVRTSIRRQVKIYPKTLINIH